MRQRARLAAKHWIPGRCDHGLRGNDGLGQSVGTSRGDSAREDVLTLREGMR